MDHLGGEQRDRYTLHPEETAVTRPVPPIRQLPVWLADAGTTTRNNEQQQKFEYTDSGTYAGTGPATMEDSAVSCSAPAWMQQPFVPTTNKQRHAGSMHDVAYTRYEDGPQRAQDMSPARLRFVSQMGQHHNPLKIGEPKQSIAVAHSGVARFRVDYGTEAGSIEDTAVSSDAPEWFQVAEVATTNKSEYAGQWYTSYRPQVHGHHTSRRHNEQEDCYDPTSHRHPWNAPRDSELLQQEHTHSEGHLERAAQQPRFQMEERSRRPVSAKPSRKPGGTQDAADNYSPLTHRFPWDKSMERGRNLLRKDDQKREQMIHSKSKQPTRGVSILSGVPVNGCNVELNTFKWSESFLNSRQLNLD